jgi:mono/diheme cytochrome c family protein
VPAFVEAWQTPNLAIIVIKKDKRRDQMTRPGSGPEKAICHAAFGADPYNSFFFNPHRKDEKMRAASLLMYLGCVGFVFGCNRASAPGSAQPPADNPAPVVAAEADEPETGPFAAGKKVFKSQGCGRCHAVGEVAPAQGPAGGPALLRSRNRGPNLGKVGAEPEHTIEWFIEHVQNPKAHKADSRMPSFEGKIREADLRTLAEYLASLK